MPAPPAPSPHLIHIHRDRVARVEARVEQQRVALGQHVEAQLADERDARPPAVLDVEHVGNALRGGGAARQTIERAER